MALSLQTLAEDLLTLEVNTIIKANMSGCKLPASRREALWEIAGDYGGKLEEYECRGTPKWHYAGIMAFRELRACARNGLTQVNGTLKQGAKLSDAESLRWREQQSMLLRIENQCDQLVSLFVELGKAIKPDFDYKSEVDAIEGRGLAEDGDHASIAWNNDVPRAAMVNALDLQLTPPQIGLIRKIWEIGTERIILQTVINVSGDITTRISERFLNNYNQTVMNLHNEAVHTTVSFWSNLAKAIADIASGLLARKKP